MKVRIDKAIYPYYEEYRLARNDGIEVDIPKVLYDKIYKAMHDYEEAQELLKKLYEETKNERG
jgi:hypothetical protein